MTQLACASARRRSTPSTMRTTSGASLPRRHEVDDAHGALVGLERRSRGPACRRGSGADGSRASPAGASSQRPCSSSPSSAAKQAGESNRGRQSQSIDPSRPTSAAVCGSPMSAYASSGDDVDAAAGCRETASARLTGSPLWPPRSARSGWSGSGCP